MDVDRLRVSCSVRTIGCSSTLERWKIALGLDLEAKLCAKSTPQPFRAKLVLHERYGELFERSV